MIISSANDKVLIAAKDGTRFEADMKGTVVMVPARDGSGGTVPGVFNFGRLILENKISSVTTADEATSALHIIKRNWPTCQEKYRAIGIIVRFLSDKREERRDDAVMKLVELYGVKRAKKLSEAVRKHRFWFPAFYMRETAVADVVKYLLDSCPGCAGSTQWSPNNKNTAEHVVSMYCDSKKLGGFKKLMNASTIDESRIQPIFDIAKFLETTM